MPKSVRRAGGRLRVFARGQGMRSGPAGGGYQHCTAGPGQRRHPKFPVPTEPGTTL